MTQQEAYEILGITEEEIEAAGAVPEGTEAAGASTETSQSFDNVFQNFNRQAVERLIKKKYRQRILSAHPDVQPEEETEYSAQQLNYPVCRKIPCFSYGDIRHFHQIYASN